MRRLDTHDKDAWESPGRAEKWSFLDLWTSASCRLWYAKYYEQKFIIMNKNSVLSTRFRSFRRLTQTTRNPKPKKSIFSKRKNIFLSKIFGKKTLQMKKTWIKNKQSSIQFRKKRGLHLDLNIFYRTKQRRWNDIYRSLATERSVLFICITCLCDFPFFALILLFDRAWLMVYAVMCWPIQ